MLFTVPCFAKQIVRMSGCLIDASQAFVLLRQNG